ncbi:MAG: hypothetical protein U5L45_24780 [Saprospiraceae bacterium]|nr:hypothetical protein [Saprospiraceae bacterium]
MGNENCKNHPSVFYLLMLRRAAGSTDFVAADFNPPKMYIPFSLRAVGSTHIYRHRPYGS